MPYRFFLISLMLILSFSSTSHTQNNPTDSAPQLIPIATNLLNPRGVAVEDDGSLLLVEAGTGSDIAGEVTGSGQISRLSDMNGDGDFDDENEREILLRRMPSYNSLVAFRSGHDEPFGLGDILLREDGRIFFTKDDPFFERRRPQEDLFYGEVGVFELTQQGRGYAEISKRIATINSIAYDEENQILYMTESGFNRLSAMDASGEVRVVADLPFLASNQQPVPSGLALDSTTGDVLVTLFSGYLYFYTDIPHSFMPYESKVVRVNPITGEVTDAAIGLTTAIDVTVDDEGNFYVLELTTSWAMPLMPYEFDLSALDAAPDPGGYARYTGRLTMFPVNNSAPVILADGIDTPTNISYHDGSLYISSGLGTPNRPVTTPYGILPIEGTLYRMDLE